MSHIYEAASQIGPVTSAAVPVATILAGASTQCEILEIEFTLAVATGTTEDPQLGRPGALGTGTPTGVLVQALDPADGAGAAQIVSTFGTLQPTVPAIPFRQMRMTTAAAALGLRWQWERGELILAPGGQLVLWQTTAQATGTWNVWIKVAENT